MYKAQNRGFDLKNRACTTLMAVLLSLLIMGCPTGGGSDPVIPGPIIIPSTSNPVPTVTDVTVTGAPSVTKSGSDVTETYNAAVTGANSPSQVVTWSIDGNPTGVSISAGGVLTVQPTAATGNITIKATSTVAGYTNKYGTVVVMINPSLPPPPPPSDTDFKTEANANLLGLYPGDDYANGAAVISAMNARISTSFYNPTILEVPSELGYGSGYKYDDVAGASPGMAWFIYNDKLVVYGVAGNATIVFNIAVIKTSDGTGWITGDGTNIPYGKTYLRTYNTGYEEISISDLTDDNITTTAGLSSYKVYVIVRWTDSFSVNRDFNENSDAFNLYNVIAVAP